MTRDELKPIKKIVLDPKHTPDKANKYMTTQLSKTTITRPDDSVKTKLHSAYHGPSNHLTDDCSENPTQTATAKPHNQAKKQPKLSLAERMRIRADVSTTPSPSFLCPFPRRMRRLRWRRTRPGGPEPVPPRNRLLPSQDVHVLVLISLIPNVGAIDVPPSVATGFCFSGSGC
jgi:hypothetical protein